MKCAETVLVVDDVPQNVSLLLDGLSQAGYRVLVAESGEAALEQLPHRVPDLILLDYRLPGMDGIETCRRILATDTCRDVPILFITAVDDVSDKVRALDAGAVDYVTKPLEPVEVLARVRTHLRIATLQRELREEIALREEAEELLRDGLNRALMVVDGEGVIQFATRLSRTMLDRHFPEAGQERLPIAVREALVAGLGEFHAGTVQVRVFHPPGRRGVHVLELVQSPGRQPADFLPLGMTPREAEVLYWVCEGKSNPEIGIILGAAARTVEKHVENILRKMGAPTRAAAVAAALERLAP